MEKIFTRVRNYGGFALRIQRSLTGKFTENSPMLCDIPWEETLPADICLTFDDSHAFVWQADGACFREVPGRHILNTDGQLIHSFCLDGCLYYGFGEKTGPLEKTGHRMRFSNKDAIGYDPEKTDPLYKHVPFFLKLNPDGKGVCGAFYHTAAECELDMGREHNGYYPPMGQFITRQEEIDLFLIRGKTMAEVVDNFTRLTGRPVLLPKFALGYLGSTMFYTELEENCDREVLGFVEKAKRLGIPCSNFQLSSGYTTDEKGRRNVFSWNKAKFPDPKDFALKMEAAGAPITPNIKPALLTTNPLYDEFAQAGAFIRRDDGRPYIGRFWGGEGSFLDFTNPRARQLWKKHLKEDLFAYGIRSVWNDNNEFDIPEGICDNDGSPLPATRLRAVLPLLMNRTAWQALEEVYPGQRHYMVSRSGCAGINAYAQVWTGDNRTGWDSLQWNIATMLGSSLSGMPLTGSDVGGFAGGAPEKELLLRWIALGAVMPRFSIHSANDDNTVTEPWMYPSAMEEVKGFFALRQKLMPYLYSLHHTAHETGSPIWRPMVWQFPQDKRCQRENVDFFLGDSLLCAPVVEKGAKTRNVWLPEGTVFYDFHTRQRYTGGQEITLDAPMDKLLLLQKGGSILPIAEKDGIHLIICPEENCSVRLYDDDGISREGAYCRREIRLQRRGDMVTLCIDSAGDYSPAPITEFHVQCTEKAPCFVAADGAVLPQILDAEAFEAAQSGWHYDAEKKLCSFKAKSAQKIQISFGIFDLIKMDV